MNVAVPATAADRRTWLSLDTIGLLVASLIVAGAVLPLAVFRANRIVTGEGRSLAEALPALPAAVFAGVLLISGFAALLRVHPLLKLLAGLLAVAALAVLMGRAASHLTPLGDDLARVSPGAGFWLLALAFTFLAVDALVRLRFGPWPRLVLMATVALAVTVLLRAGTWQDLSTLREYASRTPAFWQEARAHLVLAFGPVAAASLVGVPAGVLCYKVRRLRPVVLGGLNIVQTIPSMALFGLLIAPLAWVAANVPGASTLGVAGIGRTPALVALFAYALLPLVSNTLVGLLGVPASAVDAARGMGMTGLQRLRSVELPLAFPVILTGLRIVLVQNIGLATIAALIGGGGFGVFVFQGLGQTAVDLVLLGVVPTVALAFAAAIILDAFIEMASPKADLR